MKIVKYFILCVLAGLNCLAGLSQVVADFTADKTQGCPPSLKVTFTNNSSGSGTLSYSWSFGNGNTSTETNPQTLYASSGNYLVTLTVTNGTETNSKSILIKVFNPPTADFSSNRKGCTPFNAQLTDLSTKGDADITGWLWDYKDGRSSTEKNPQVQYNFEGTYTILLTVTDNNGCTATTQKTNYIDVANQPMVSFVASPSTACKVPTTVSFNNQSSGKGVLTYEWNYGNGSTGTSKNPVAIYNSFGTYNVSLKVNSDYGCSNSIIVPAVTISQVNAVGEITQNSRILQATDYACATEIKFVNQSTGNPNCSWDFGDNNFSYDATTFHTYAKSGTFNVKLISSPGNSCADTAKWNITIEKVEANFSFAPSSTCYEPVKVDFTNLSASASTYLWKFHDNSTQTTNNATYTYTLLPDKDPYVIHKNESFPVTLDATSLHGCVHSVTKSFIISKPTALLYSDIKEGCAPLTVNFSENSTSSDEAINLRKWIFGDGDETTTGAQKTAQHTYNTPGTYKAKIVVSTVNCKDTSYNVTINVGQIPEPDFQVTSATPFYSSQPVSINDITPALYNVDYWKYSINGENITSCPDVQNVSYKYRSDIGPLPVTLTVGSNGCYKSKTINNAITSLGPISSFTYNINCASSLLYSFNGITKGAASYKWDFGDFSTETTTLTPTHTYGAAGNYHVKLITYLDGYSDTSMQTITVRQPNPLFTMNSESCANSAVKMVGKASHPIFTSCRDKYVWDFGDGSPKIITDHDSVYHSYTKRGNYNVTLKALYENGCTPTITKNITIFQPYAILDADTTKGCTDLIVNFTDKSLPDTHPLSDVTWNFANGSPEINTASGVSLRDTFSLPTGEYSYTFPVAITVNDNFGCVNRDTLPISISSPFADFVPMTLTSLCTSDSIKFMRYFPDPDSAIWNMGNGDSINSLKVPFAYKYKDGGEYGMSLTIYKYNCSKRLEMQVGYTRIQKADAHFSTTDSVFDCPININFDHNAVMSAVDSGRWYFGDGYSGSYLKTPIHTYNLSGKYRIKLRVHTSFGCMDTFSRVINIKGPVGNFIIDRAQACKGDTVTFSLATQDTLNVKSFEWDMSEGVFKTGNPVKYAFKSTGSKNIGLILYGNKADCPFTVLKPFQVENVNAIMNIADSVICENVPVQFFNQSEGNTSLNWDLGNGTITSEPDPITEYEPGNYKVSLRVANNNNCRDTAFKTMVININPPLVLHKDTFLCVGNSVDLAAITDGDSISWQPNKWINDPNSYTPHSTPDSSVYYKALSYYRSTGCFTKDSVLVTVQQKLNFKLTPHRDTSIIIGEYIDFVIEPKEPYEYLWTPSTGIACVNCAFNTVMPIDSITYSLHVNDFKNCFSVDTSFKIFVKDTALFSAPTAFLPSGDEANRILYVQGKGIKQLLSFKIYNRWGNLVFESNDLSKGWDGKFQGKDQPIDNYIYTITIETISGKILAKKGTVLLLR